MPGPMGRRYRRGTGGEASRLRCGAVEAERDGRSLWEMDETAVAEKASQRWCCQWDGMQSPHASLSDMVTTLYGIYGIICQVAGTFLKTHHLGIDAHEKVSAGMDIC